MTRNFLGAALASAAIVIAGPSLAAPGGSAGAGVHANTHVNVNVPKSAPSQSAANARVSSQGAVNASAKGVARSNVRSSLHANANTALSARGAKSQSLMNASFNAIAHASPKSALARGSVSASTLPGLATGMTVKGNGGATIGTVNRVVTGTDGRIRLVVATNASGRTIRLVPNKLSVSSGIVTTTSM